MGTIFNSSSLSSYLQSLLSNQLQSAGVESPQTRTNASVLSAVSAPQADQSKLSLFSQIVSSLEKLQESNPSEYKQITGQIATSLQRAATAAEASGDSQASSALNQLAKVFSDVSKSGRLPQFAAFSPTSGQYSRPTANIVGGADAPIVGGADAPIVGGADAKIVGGADAKIVGGADAPIVGGADAVGIIFGVLQHAGLIVNH